MTIPIDVDSFVYAIAHGVVTSVPCARIPIVAIMRADVLASELRVAAPYAIARASHQTLCDVRARTGPLHNAPWTGQAHLTCGAELILRLIGAKTIGAAVQRAPHLVVTLRVVGTRFWRSRAATLYIAHEAHRAAVGTWRSAAAPFHALVDRTSDPVIAMPVRGAFVSHGIHVWTHVENHIWSRVPGARVLYPASGVTAAKQHQTKKDSVPLDQRMPPNGQLVLLHDGYSFASEDVLHTGPRFLEPLWWHVTL